ncbi:MAG: DNA cytosine methyltransferase [Bacteroidota bacterium]
MTEVSTKFKVADLLCGLGGATQGCHQSDYVEVVEGLNHNEHAIMINKANHPNVKFHIVNLYEHDDLKPCDIVIAGIECTNHSNAKGGMSRNPDSRAMANEMFRYSKITGCSVMILENVREFLHWGPLKPKKDKDGNSLKVKRGKEKGKIIMIPDPAKKGRYFHKWKYKMQEECGFVNFQMRILNAADYGVATTRKRLFMIFTKEGWNIQWPEPTHFKTANNLFGQKPWVPCSKFINLQDHGKSIFGRTKKDGTPNPLSDNTLARIAYGIKKYALKNKNFIIQYYGNNQSSSKNEPLPTVTTKDRHALITTDQFYIQNYHNTNSYGSVEKPIKTVVTKDEKAFISIELLQFIDKYFGNEKNIGSIQNPMGTITTGKGIGLITSFIAKQFSSNGKPNQVQDIKSPLHTVTGSNNKQLVNVQFMQTPFTRNTPTVRSTGDPLRTVTTSINPSLVSADLVQFIHNQNYGSTDSLENPLKTLTTNQRKSFITAEIVQFISKHFGGNHASSIEAPLSTITTIDHNTLVSLHIGKGLFLLDIKMRWLRPRELASCQGFPEDYKLIGTKREQIKGIGNSIPPPLITAIVDAIGEANQEKLIESKT